MLPVPRHSAVRVRYRYVMSHLAQVGCYIQKKTQICFPESMHDEMKQRDGEKLVSYRTPPSEQVML